MPPPALPAHFLPRPEGADLTADGDARLLAVVMHDYQLGEPIPRGARTTFIPFTSGDLYLRGQDDLHRLANNGGKLTVHFRRALP